jgi:hypothetical protein
MPYVSVDVDVELDDFDNEDIIDYMERQGYEVSKTISVVADLGDPKEELRLIWEAMYLGKPYDAMVRKFVSDHTGRFL